MHELCADARGEDEKSSKCVLRVVSRMVDFGHLRYEKSAKELIDNVMEITDRKARGHMAGGLKCGGDPGRSERTWRFTSNIQ